VRQEEALAVWWVLALAFALGLLPRLRPTRGALIPLAAIALLAAWTAVSLTWTSSDERTTEELARVLHYAGLLILVWALVDRTTWRAAAAGVAVGAFVIVGLAVASRLDPGAFPTNYIHRAFHTNRLNYPFNYWNAVGAWSVMSIAIGLGWSSHAARALTRCALLAVVPAAGLAVYLTYSRGGAVGSALVILVVLALSRNRWTAAAHCLAAAGGTAIALLVARGHHEIAQSTGGAGGGAVLLALIAGMALCALAAALVWLVRLDRVRAPRPLGRLSVAGAVAVLALLAATVGSHTISRGWHEFRHGTTVASSDPAARLVNLSGNRYNEWKTAFDAFKAEPLHGIGPGTFEFWWNRHGGQEFVRDAHSLYFESLGEMGVPGLFLVAGFLLGLGGMALRALRRVAQVDDLGPAVGLSAAFVMFLFHAGIDWMWESTAVTVLAIVCAGIVSAPLFARGARPRVGARAVLAVVAVVAGLVQLPGLVSTSRIRDSQQKISHGDVGAALAIASDAVDAEPWAASPYVQRGLVEESAGELKAASVDLRRAESREPDNWRHPLILARIDAERGDARAALADFARARRLRPQSPFFTQQ
jgi:hypothetical protein